MILFLKIRFTVCSGIIFRQLLYLLGTFYCIESLINFVDYFYANLFVNLFVTACKKFYYFRYVAVLRSVMKFFDLQKRSLHNFNVFFSKNKLIMVAILCMPFLCIIRFFKLLYCFINFVWWKNDAVSKPICGKRVLRFSMDDFVLTEMKITCWLNL